MKVSIIGMGYVGLNLAMAIPSEIEVVGFDVNRGLVENLLQGKSHIEGISDELLAKKIKVNSFHPTINAGEIADSDIVIIAVPTPLDSKKEPDLTFLQSACETIAANVARDVLVVNESTSFPGTLRDFIKPHIEEKSNPSLKFEFAVSPERVDPGNKQWNLFNTPRLISGLTDSATQKAMLFYGSFCSTIIEVSSPEVAESAKLFENTFRQVNIALVNEFAQIAHALGISVYEVLDAANTKPYGFMKFRPSAGVGGHCIPVDPTYLSSTAEKVGVPAKFINLANKTNLEMGNYIVSRVQASVGPTLENKRIQIIGVAYKPDVADTRETPAAIIVDALRKLGAVVSWHDPLVREWRNEASSELGYSDIAIVVTKHSEVSSESILSSASYVFDTTGHVIGAETL